MRTQAMKPRIILMAGFSFLFLSARITVKGEHLF